MNWNRLTATGVVARACCSGITFFAAQPEQVAKRVQRVFKKVAAARFCSSCFVCVELLQYERAAVAQFRLRGRHEVYRYIRICSKVAAAYVYFGSGLSFFSNRDFRLLYRCLLLRACKVKDPAVPEAATSAASRTATIGLAIIPQRPDQHQIKGEIKRD